MKRLRILIVEDDQDWQDVLKEILRHNDLEPVIAKNFSDALRLARDSETRLDCAVIDKGGRGSVRTPTEFGYHDGLDVIKELLQINPYCRTLLLTGESFSRSAIKSGAYAYSNKGWLDPNMLVKILKKGPLLPQEMSLPIIDISEYARSSRPEIR